MGTAEAAAGAASVVMGLTIALSMLVDMATDSYDAESDDTNSGSAEYK
jgi:hypothetical protein